VDCPACGEPEMIEYMGEDDEPDIKQCPECGHTEEV
jgi:ssDNA-binding Zn-finger/Zn-ribbon topoisomerase 1